MQCKFFGGKTLIWSVWFRDSCGVWQLSTPDSGWHLSTVPCAVSEAAEKLTVTGMESSVSWPETAQTVTDLSSSVTVDALPTNLTSGTPEIPVGKHPASHLPFVYTVWDNCVAIENRSIFLRTVYKLVCTSFKSEVRILLHLPWCYYVFY